MKRNSRIYLIRHGQIEGYENIPAYGHTDVGLTETGLLQMEHMCDRLRLLDITAIYSSDLKRSASGAHIISRHHNVPLHFLPKLREMYFGDWEGMALSQVRELYSEELNKRQEDLLNYKIPGGGETISLFADRVNLCFKRILSDQQGNDFVIVGHGGVNRIILCDALGLDLSRMFNINQDYGCLNIIDYSNDYTLVRLING